MFNKLSLIALAAPLANALTLNIPQNPVSGGPVTITWTTQPGDPATFSLELTNDVFHNSFAIANNLFPEQQSITLTLPIVPVGDGYTLEAVDVGNINNVFSSTGGFSIGANPSATASTPSSTSPLTSATAPVTKSTGLPSASHVVSTSVFGSTVSVPSGSAASAGNSAAVSGSSQSSAPSSTPLNNGVTSAFALNRGAVAGVLLSALAGAAVLVL